MNFAIAVAVPRERESQPAPGASLVLKLSMRTDINLKSANEGFGQDTKPPL
jgi:hypothetical protein